MSGQTSFQQIARGMFRYPSGGWQRLFYKAPLMGWRAGLGPLLAPLRMLVLTTRGRKSGLPRHIMVEHTVMNGKAYIAPGWGTRTLWYRNIAADPHVTVQRGRHAYGAIARAVIDERELSDLYFATGNASPVWKKYLASWDVQDSLEDFLAKRDRLIALRLDPTNEMPLPPLQPDLLWIWPALAGVGLAAWLATRSKK